jgi:hypothetical protein
MKVAFLILEIGALLTLVLAAPARAETFDLVTFTPPAGQRNAQPDSVNFTESAGSAFCQVAVYHSLPGSGDPARDFEAEWDGLVAKRYHVAGTRTVKTVDRPGGWKLTVGAAPVSAAGAGDFVSMLAVFTGHGVRVPVLVNYNDERYQEKFNSFLAGMQLRPPSPAAPAAAVAAAPADIGGAPPLVGRKWYRSIAQYSNWGFNPTPEEISKISDQGYARWTYAFNSDGSYSFVGEFWSMSKYQEYWFREESGTFRVSGDTIRLAPSQTRRVLRNKSGQPQGEALPTEAEPTTYRYQFHYFEGIGEWNLVLTPADGRETRRDGSFANNKLFSGSYLFGDPPAEN